MNLSHLYAHIAYPYSSVLDLTFEENVQSPRNLEMFTFPLLEGGCSMSVTTENKVSIVAVCV